MNLQRRKDASVKRRKMNNEAECEERVKPLSLLCVKSTETYLKGLISVYVNSNSSETFTNYLRDVMQSIPPNFHAEFLDKLAPFFDFITCCEVSQPVLDFIDELALILLSPSISQIDVDKFKFPTRNPSKYLKALGLAKSLKAFVSQKENVWEYSISKFKLLSSALIRMPLLIHVTLRHLKVSSREINILLEGLASNSPHLSYLDLKYSAITDSGFDTTKVEKFGRKCDYVDCIPSLLKMKNLRHLNISESWLSYSGVKAIVQNLPLERLDAVMDESYDIQAVVIKNLLASDQDPPLSLARKAYCIAHEEQYVSSVCKACPLLEHVTIQQCYNLNIITYFSALAELKFLKKITLCGLEWSLHGSHIPIDDEPQVISPLVTEITLQEPSCVDAHSLGVLSICFPQITHLWIIGSQDEISDDAWTRGRAFTKLTHLHYQGSLYAGEFGRLEREQGLQNVLDVLLGWCKQLRCLTLYTDYLDLHLLFYPVQRNGLHYLEELRIGLQKDLSEDTIMCLLRGTYVLKILGRTDWWTSMTVQSRQVLINLLKARYWNLEVYGLDDTSDVDRDPRPNSFHQRSYVW
ncbi:uncharacterized protein HSPBAP1 isoform X1 [Palaemon carinicauda]|uniref:uncharacterized protein HSPBAP1 isoform X1 n=1 Tax=Palaemon carinicauda TaxID=392227 RepID=UPI0035B59851